MKALTDPAQVWTTTPTPEEHAAGVHYASISLPWTFNRMMMKSTPSGQHDRAYNIVKGIVAQEVLVRLLEDHGVDVVLPRDSHRDDDLFDIQVDVEGELMKGDSKAVTYFSDYGAERPDFSLDYLLEHRAYDGPRWDRFFPMLLPHTQLNQDKELFVFAMAETIDFRAALWEGRSEHELYSFPHGEFCEFTQKRQLIEAREEAGAGISFSIEYDTPSYFEARLPRLELIGEWAGEIKRETVTLEKNATSGPVGPFSALNSVRMPHEDYRNNFSGNLHFSVAANGLDTPVRNTARRNLNVLPRNREAVDGDRPMTIQKTDFINLRLPDDYTIHVLGWITKPRFLRRCREYRSWIWPDDSTDRMQNQPWSQLTEKDETMLTRIGLDDVIQDCDHRIGAGFLKGIPFGGSAATYVFPNQHGGGLRETNAYVLPHDLRPMDDLLPPS